MAQTEGNRSSRAGVHTPPNACPARLRGAESKATPREGRLGRWMCEIRKEAKRERSIGSAREG